MPSAKFALAALLLSHLSYSWPHQEDLIVYKTHPEITLPRWELNIAQPDKVTPGYWFLTPQDHLDGQPKIKPGWLAPAIYDNAGELVWSAWNVAPGVSQDFQVSNVLGRNRLTWLNYESKKGHLLDLNFDNLDSIMVDRGDFDAHEWHFVDEGRLGIRTIARWGREMESAELIPSIPGFNPKLHCKFRSGGFEVFDVATFTPTFTWDSLSPGHIPIAHGRVGNFSKADCGPVADYAHTNAVDLDHNKNYFLSSRSADRIYKISKDDGHIMWTLDGLQGPDGPWDMGDVSFSRQHNVRFHGFNGTHEIISILDNAVGEDGRAPTHDRSRGLVLALQPDANPPTARMVSSIGHPDGAGGYAPRRGNYQILDNGHKWICWSERALHSEHDTDGKLVMSARFAGDWIGTYRSYKQNFSGRPHYPPKAVSFAEVSAVTKKPITVVYVSWNGATDIDSYRLFATDSRGNQRVEIANTRRTGFETAVVSDVLAEYVVVQVLGRDGDMLGETGVTATASWTGDVSASSTSQSMVPVSTRGSTLPVIAAVCFSGAIFTLVAIALRKFVKANGGLSLSALRHRYKAISGDQESHRDDLDSADSGSVMSGLLGTPRSRSVDEIREVKAA